MTHLVKTKGFNQRSQSLHFHKGQYDPNTQSVPDESFLNGDVRDVQDGRGYLFDGVDSQIQIITSNQGTLYVSAQLQEGSLDTDISITYDTDRYKIEKSNNEAVQNIKVWTVSDATIAEKKSKELESNLFAWFKCDESALDDSFDSSGNNNDGKIANANLSTFHTISDKLYSWQNNVGYTYDSANDRYIPRDESNPDKDVQGNELQYKGKVPYTVYAKDSNCGKFDGVGSYVDTGHKFNFIAKGVFDISFSFYTYNDVQIQAIMAMTDFRKFGMGLSIIFNRNGDKEIVFIFYGVGAFYSSKKFYQNKFYNIRYIGDGSSLKLYVNGVLDSSVNVDYSQRIGDIFEDELKIGANNDNTQNFLDGFLTNIQITNPNNSADNAHYLFSEGNDNFVYDVSGNGYHGEIKNASITDFWSERQDQFHYNIEHGFDLWLDGSGNKLYVPFDENGNSIKTQGDTISGYSWDSKHQPSTNFHNGAETRFDTDAEDPHFGDFKRAVSDTGLHPSNSVSGDDRYYIRKLPDDEADRFTLYLNDQVGPQKLKTELFTQ